MGVKTSEISLSGVTNALWILHGCMKTTCNLEMCIHNIFNCSDKFRCETNTPYISVVSYFLLIRHSDFILFWSGFALVTSFFHLHLISCYLFSSPSSFLFSTCVFLLSNFLGCWFSFCFHFVWLLLSSFLLSFSSCFLSLLLISSCSALFFPLLLLFSSCLNSLPLVFCFCFPLLLFGFVIFLFCFCFLLLFSSCLFF